MKSQEGFRIRKDQILPTLEKQAKKLRLKWSHDFWVFWYFTKFVKKEDAVFVLTHMDKKWFFAVRERSNCKVCTSIGLKPVGYRVHHKSHVQKEMYVVVTACVLNDNDITKGGTAIRVSCVRVGKNVPAKKTSYKRVCKPDGSYHYPKVTNNVICKKGNMYFKSFELKGSSEDTTRKPKISLLKLYQEHNIPDLERKVVTQYSNNGTRKVIIVKQEDGTGLHQDKIYVRTMNDLFHQKGWIIFNQPSRSQVRNVHNTCIFPMMSKKVSTSQALEYGAVLLRGDQLYDTVKSVKNDLANRVAMARAFA